EGLVDFPRSVEGAEVGLLFRQTAQGDTKVSFRSNGPVDVNVLAREFGGGGHVRASGALVADPPHKVVPQVVAATRDAVRAMRAGSRTGGGSEGTPALGGT
ncbi:MAG TPA: DHHA1 domain-containing protein, partial [Longimicrobiales bacterium]|nr:DHHA1 domain-containing protein [Longimicrobiales bacterium]